MLGSLLWSGIAAATSAAAFKFNVLDAPTSCDPTRIEWNGGVPPFTLHFFPLIFSPLNVSIPSSAVNADRSGSYSVLIPFTAGQDVVFVMSDATGFASGGASARYVVGAGKGTTACDTSSPSLSSSFYFAMTPENTFQQCSTVSFRFTNMIGDGRTDPELPIAFIGVVPGGTVFTHYRYTKDDWRWVADIAAGTDVFFTVWDMRGRGGGGVGIQKIVGGPNTCLGPLSPRSTSLGFVTTAPLSVVSSSSSFRAVTAASSRTSQTRGITSASRGTVSTNSANTAAGLGLVPIGSVYTVSGKSYTATGLAHSVASSATSSSVSEAATGVFSTGMIAGITVGGLLFLLAVIGAFFFYSRYRQQRALANKKANPGGGIFDVDGMTGGSISGIHRGEVTPFLSSAETSQRTFTHSPPRPSSSFTGGSPGYSSQTWSTPAYHPQPLFSTSPSTMGQSYPPSTGSSSRHTYTASQSSIAAPLPTKRRTADDHGRQIPFFHPFEPQPELLMHEDAGPVTRCGTAGLLTPRVREELPPIYKREWKDAHWLG